MAHNVEVMEARAAANPDAHGNITTFVTVALLPDKQQTQDGYMRTQPGNVPTVGTQYVIEVIPGKNPNCPKLKVVSRLSSGGAANGNGGGFAAPEQQASFGDVPASNGHAANGNGHAAPAPQQQTSGDSYMPGPARVCEILTAINELTRYMYQEMRQSPWYKQIPDEKILTEAGIAARQMLVMWDRSNGHKFTLKDMSEAMSELLHSSAMKGYTPAPPSDENDEATEAFLNSLGGGNSAGA